MAYLVREVGTGYPDPGIPAWRCYVSLEKAKRAAERAAAQHGRAYAYGWAKPGSDNITTQHGEAQPRHNG